MEGTNGYPSQVFVAYAVARPPFSPFARVWGRYEPVGEDEPDLWFLVRVTYPGVEQSLSAASLERIPSPGMREYARGFRLAFTTQPRFYLAHEGESILRCTACAAILWFPEEFGYAFCEECVKAEEGRCWSCAAVLHGEYEERSGFCTDCTGDPDDMPRADLLDAIEELAPILLEQVERMRDAYNARGANRTPTYEVDWSEVADAGSMLAAIGKWIRIRADYEDACVGRPEHPWGIPRCDLPRHYEDDVDRWERDREAAVAAEGGHA